MWSDLIDPLPGLPASGAIEEATEMGAVVA